MSCETTPTVKWPRTHPDLVTISSIGGARITYVPGTCSIVGDEGGFVDPYVDNSLVLAGPGTSSCHKDFAPLLDAWMTNLQYFSDQYGGYGDVTDLYHYGIHPPGSTRVTFHNEGRALDITGIDWQNGQWWRACAGDEETTSTTRYRRLVGVEASLRKYFGTVVSRGYRGIKNGVIQPFSHANHYHADAGCPVGFSTNVESHQLFARDCIRALTTNSSNVDYLSSDTTNPRQWSDTHQAALDGLLAALGMDCFDIKRNVSEYLIFLDYIMMHGFADRAAGHYRWGGLIDL